ncbi:MAG: phenylalanine--tRNA ligase subunit beta [Nocardiopsaceae bacterium]|nr:phenylalanine--tRNA ligase subunit beta [Nocardiopsaceae bacterium]
MRVPISWLREYAPVPEPADPAGTSAGIGAGLAADIAARLTAAGLEVEAVERVGHDVSGVVTGVVLAIEELTGFKKPIRYCRVADSDSLAAGAPDDAHGVICGATNFSVGDRIAFARVGAVLPGDFEITARKTYGHVSEGMICAVDELGVGEDHSGIMVLPPDTPLGADFVTYAGLRDWVLDIAVTPDRGYAVSVRGVARELASAYGVPFTDPVTAAEAASVAAVGGDLAAVGDVYPASIGDPSACDRFVLREVRGFSPDAVTPLWMQVRLARCGVRSVSLAVDVTNYLLLELGQPLHAFDRSKLSGPIVVRRAAAGEKLQTLDHVKRTLSPEDILITDSSGPISMAGTMGGLSTEIDENSTDLVIEGAHFDEIGTAKMSRRHRLHSEASYRFERGVDRELPLAATARAVALLAELGGGTVVPGCTHAEAPAVARVITMAADYPDRVAGVDYGLEVVVRRLTEVGCAVRAASAAAAPSVAPWNANAGHSPAGSSHGGSSHGGEVQVLEVTSPSWRPDLTDPADLAEEVIRLEGYANLPVRAPRALAGRGLTAGQRLIRAIGRALGGAGFTEVSVEPFAPATDADSLLLPADDERRPAVVVANPLSDDAPNLRTTLLPGLFRTAVRNIGRGFADVALFETGLVFRPRPGAPGRAPILATDRGPSDEELASLEAALPDQPRLVGGVLAGNRDLPGWWGGGRAADWADAIEAARAVAAACHLTLEVRAAQTAPWHPGRCAALYVRVASGGDGTDTGGQGSDGQGAGRQEWLAGHAGELHPRVIAAYGLPSRACAFELDFGVLSTAADAAGPVRAPALPSYPLATRDVAVVVPEAVPAAEVAAALRAGAGELLEDVRLFDVYTGAQLAAGSKSLAYTLRFRAADRTLTAAEATAARDAAVAEAAGRCGAVLRS